MTEILRVHTYKNSYYQILLTSKKNKSSQLGTIKAIVLANIQTYAIKKCISYSTPEYEQFNFYVHYVDSNAIKYISDE